MRRTVKVHPSFSLQLLRTHTHTHTHSLTHAQSLSFSLSHALLYLGICSGPRVLDNATIPNCCLPSQKDCQGRGISHTLTVCLPITHSFIHLAFLTFPGICSGPRVFDNSTIQKCC